MREDMPVWRPTSREAGIRWWATFVYHLVDPRDGEVFYVGKGRADRLRQHEREAELGTLTEKCQRIRDIWAAGKQVEMRFVGLFQYPTPSTTVFQYEAEQIDTMTEQLAQRGRHLTNGRRLPEAGRAP